MAQITEPISLSQVLPLVQKLTTHEQKQLVRVLKSQLEAIDRDQKIERFLSTAGKIKIDSSAILQLREESKL